MTASAYVCLHLFTRLCSDPSSQNIVPFAVVGSENTVLIDGKSVRGRKNRWGVVNVEDPNHCEFVNLRDFLTRFVLSFPLHSHFQLTFFALLLYLFHRTHLQDLIETTAQIHYEAFRSKQLLALKEGVNQRPAQ
jgi:septin 3/9/12